jgi:four helix bundle protein
MNDFYYRKLKVYQLSMQLVAAIYKLTEKFPSSEKLALTNQIQRAAVSVPSNIAEGMGRFSIRERIHHLDFSSGSLMEVMCQTEIAELLGYITHEDLIVIENLVKESEMTLIGLRKSLESKDNNLNV